MKKSLPYPLRLAAYLQFPFGCTVVLYACGRLLDLGSRTGAETPADFLMNDMWIVGFLLGAGAAGGLYLHSEKGTYRVRKRIARWINYGLYPAALIGCVVGSCAGGPHKLSAFLGMAALGVFASWLIFFFTTSLPAAAWNRRTDENGELIVFDAREVAIWARYGAPSIADGHAVHSWAVTLTYLGRSVTRVHNTSAQDGARPTAPTAPEVIDAMVTDAHRYWAFVDSVARVESVVDKAPDWQTSVLASTDTQLSHLVGADIYTHLVGRAP